MKQELPLQHTRWIKITQPTKKEIETTEQEFDIHPLVVKELSTPTIRPKVESYDHHAYMVLHVPVFEPNDRKTYPKEIDFVLTKNAIITVSYQEIKPLEEFWDIARKKDGDQFEDTGHFLYQLLHHVFVFSLRQLDHIQENINTIEDMMFYGSDDEVTKDIYVARRDLIDFRRTLKPQEATLRSLADETLKLYGKQKRVFFMSIIEEYLRVSDLLNSHAETMRELYETNESIVSGRINKTMKVFAILAFLTFIPSLITNIFGMQIPFPYQQSPELFWIVLVSSIALTLSIYLYFKARGIL